MHPGVIGAVHVDTRVNVYTRSLCRWVSVAVESACLGPHTASLGEPGSGWQGEERPGLLREGVAHLPLLSKNSLQPPRFPGRCLMHATPPFREAILGSIFVSEEARAARCLSGSPHSVTLTPSPWMCTGPQAADANLSLLIRHQTHRKESP